MKKNSETLCWDCPSRTGLSRIFGKLAFKYWSIYDRSGKEIARQRGDCPGKVPARYMSDSSTTLTEREGVYTKEVTSHYYYESACPKVYTPEHEVPVHVNAAMRNNNLDLFVDESTAYSEIPRDEYEADKAEILAKWQEIRGRSGFDS